MSRKPAYHPLRGKQLMVTPVGQKEIAERAGVQMDTVKKWRERHPGFPKPRWTVGGNPAWAWPEVHKWLRDNARAPHFRRWVVAGFDRIIEENLNADDEWEPTFTFIGNDFDGWQAIPSKSAEEEFNEPQLIADNHLRSWCEARVKWVAENPDEQMPEHLAGIPWNKR